MDLMKPRRILICFEGAEWADLSARIDAGELPAMAALIERGACGTLGRFSSLPTMASAVSLATGCHPARHDVLAPLRPDPESDQIHPVVASDRQVPGLWDILSAAGVSVQSVGWPASHGSQPKEGMVVSNAFGDPLVPQDASALSSMIHPERLVAPLSELVLHPEATTAEMIEFFVPRWQEIHQDHDPRLALVGRALAQIASTHNAFTWLLENESASFSTAYYRCPISLSSPPNHRDDRAGDDPFGNPAGAAWRHLDLMLARIIDLTGGDASIWVVGLPSRETSEASGFLIATGPEVVPDSLILGARVTDVVPSVLASMGFLIEEGTFDGRVLPELVPEFERSGATRRALPGESDLEPPLTGEPIRQSSDELRRFLHHAEGVTVVDNDQLWKQARKDWQWLRSRTLAEAGRYLEALPLLEELAEQQPERVDYAALLADSQFHLGLLAEALENARVVAELAPAQANGLLLQARIEAEMGSFEEAAQTIEEAKSLQPDHPELLIQLAVILTRLRRWDEVIQLCERVLERHPESAEAHLGMARAMLALRRLPEARSWALEAIARNYAIPLAHLVLGVTLLRQDHKAEAAMAFETALRLQPGLAVAHHYLARIMRQKEGQRNERHVRVMERTRLKNEKIVAMRREAQDREADRARARARSRETASHPDHGGRDKHQLFPSAPLRLQAVTGLPRAGLSLLMQMLQAAGTPILTDGGQDLGWSGLAELDTNPSLLAEVGDRIVRLPGILVPRLPRLHYYRLVYVHRSADELAASHLRQQQLDPNLATGLPGGLRDIHILLRQHEYETRNYLRDATNVEFLEVAFTELVRNPRETGEKIADFLGPQIVPNPEAMSNLVNPALVHAKSDAWGACHG